MNEFVLLFRWSKEQTPSPEQMQTALQHWQEWMGSIAAQNKLASPGNPLGPEGRVVRSGTVTDGPYAELKEAVGGYIIIRAADFDEAVGVALACPIAIGGGCVEVRKVSGMDGN
jgi:hypothetical protein